MDEEPTEHIVECTDCGRTYRAVTTDETPPDGELECHCGNERFARRARATPHPAH